MSFLQPDGGDDAYPKSPTDKPDDQLSPADSKAQPLWTPPKGDDDEPTRPAGGRKRNWLLFLSITLLLLSFYALWQSRETAHTKTLADKDEAQAKALADKEEAHLAVLKEKDVILEANIQFALDQVRQIEGQIGAMQEQVDLLNANYKKVIVALNDAVDRQGRYKKEIADLKSTLDRKNSQLIALNAEIDKLEAERTQLQTKKDANKKEIQVQQQTVVCARQHVQYCRQRVHHSRRFCRLF